MKKNRLLIGLLLIALCAFVFVACGTVENETVNDAIRIANIKTEISRAFRDIVIVNDLLVDSERGVITCSVPNETDTIDLSSLKISSGTLMIDGAEPTTLTLAEGESVFTVSATSGTLTVNYTLKITRKAATNPTVEPEPTTDPTTEPVADPDEPAHTHTFAETWSKDREYHWHAATCEHTTEVKDKAAHAFGSWDSFIRATCIAKGEDRRYCPCGAYESRVVEIDPSAHEIVHHDGNKETCTEIGWRAYDSCSRCNFTTYEEIPALGHDYGDWFIYTSATCVSKGIERSKCSRCENFISRETDIDIDNHELVHHEAKAATYAEIGWSEYDSCLLCEYTTYHEIPCLKYVIVW